MKKLMSYIRFGINYILNSRGYTLRKIGGGYHNPEILARLAHASDISICEYLELLDDDPRKIGRRDRIIDKIKHLFRDCHMIVEIGAGTGMYMEKVLQLDKPYRYIVYETDRGWINYLHHQYINTGCEISFPLSDGETLKDTPDNSCDLVHAHGVFVYIPVLQIFSYIKEAARTLSSGGYLIFDCYLDSSFKGEIIQDWLKSEWRFPIVLPEKMLMEYIHDNGFELVSRFDEIHGASFGNYLIFRKS
jgi:SAM-dependent methyltransferase